MQQQFSDLLLMQRACDGRVAAFLEEMAKRFPYCQPAQMLYAKALMACKSPLFEEQLNIAVACAPDRRLFKAYLAERDDAKPSKKAQDKMIGQEHSAEALKTEDKPVASQSNENKILRQQRIIDRFLEQNPRIRPGAERNVDEGDMAAGSIEDKADLASETLAEVLLKQGKKEQAIMIYNKLSLMFPEKSSYFAKKLEHIQNENN